MEANKIIRQEDIEANKNSWIHLRTDRQKMEFGFNVFYTIQFP